MGRIGGGLIILAGAALAYVLAQPPLDVDGSVYPPNLSVPVALFGLGAALVSAAGPRPLAARLTRVGIGLLALGAFAVVVANALENTGNPMAPLTPLLNAIGAFVSGLLATGARLVRSRGLARWVGAAILVGISLVAIGQIVGGGQVSPPLIMQLGFVVAGLGLAGVAVLAMGLQRLASDTPA